MNHRHRSSNAIMISPILGFMLIIVIRLGNCHPTSEFPETVAQDHLEMPQSDQPRSFYGRKDSDVPPSGWNIMHKRLREHGPLELVNNGYDGLTVAISDSVPQEHCNLIIHGLKVRNT